MKKLFSLVLVACLLLVGVCLPGAQAAPLPPTTYLVGADGQVVGYVYVNVLPDYLTFEIQVVDPNVCLNALTYDLAYSYDHLPMSGSGNPRLSKFDFHDDLSCPTYIVRWIPLDPIPVSLDGLYLAIEAEGPDARFWAAGIAFPGPQWGEYIFIPLGPNPI
jgi:hypothetical protein